MVRWRLKEYLEENDVSAYALTKVSELSPNAIYTIARGETNQVRLDTLAELLAGLRKLTGREVSLEAVLEFDPGPPPLDAEDQLWLDAHLAAPMEPYDWGDEDPTTLGKPIRYEAGVGIVVEGGKDGV